MDIYRVQKFLNEPHQRRILPVHNFYFIGNFFLGMLIFGDILLQFLSLIF